jgi:HD-GYP domain-containing protein (c-di-GMP phosphodiesterase class II)
MYAIQLAKRVGLPQEKLEALSRGGLLHDLGKIGIPDNILLKPGKLTAEEWKLMRRHPEIGYMILKNIDFLIAAQEVVLCHHERFDGAGYPRRLKGEEIPVVARIFSVADAFDSMTTDRPYRKAMAFREAMCELEKNANFQFDPNFVDMFLNVPKEEWEKIRGFTLVPYPGLYY